MRRLNVFLACLLTTLASLAVADGKFYARGEPPPGIPYQRALVVFDGERQVLLVQSQRPAGASGSLGWIVPVPALPDIGTLESDAADLAFKKLRTETTLATSATLVLLILAAAILLFQFARLARADYRRYRDTQQRPALIPYLPGLYYLIPFALMAATAPGWRLTRDEDMTLTSIALGFVALSLFGGVLLWVFLGPFQRWVKRDFRDVFLRIAGYAVFLLLGALLLSVGIHGCGKKSEMPKAAAAPAEAAKVEVLRQARFGKLDVKVIAATASGDGAAVRNWLNENGFAFGAEDNAIFDQHVKRGWVFAVARLDDDAPAARLTPPLLLRFPTRQAVYPLALTGSGGARTQVDLYTLASSPLTPAKPQRARYADELIRIKSAGELLAGAKTNGWATREVWPERHLAFYEMYLSPEDMKEDLLFTSAPTR